MRYINLQKLERDENWPPEGWEEMLREAEAELRAMPPGKERSALFEKYSQKGKYKEIWQRLKKRLRDLSYDKCWYCETSTHRMPNEIDHYRPKGRVTEAGNSHFGYWWLMFEWRNFRFTCRLCNSRFPDYETGVIGGKGNHFPLFNQEQDRIKSESDYQDYEDLLHEIPMLLDPTNRDDPSLLTFNVEGKPKPKALNEESPDYQRAAISIDIYHLDFSSLNRARRDIRYEIIKLIKDYERFETEWTDKKDRLAYVSAKKVFEKLGGMVADNAPYSAATKAYLGEFCKKDCDWYWVNRLLS